MNPLQAICNGGADADLQPYKELLRWAKEDKNIVLVRKDVVDIAGDLTAGILLSQLLYWFLPSKEAKTRLKVKWKERFWVAKARHEWFEECRISHKKAIRALDILLKKNLILKEVHKFKGAPTHFFRVNFCVLADRIKELKAQQAQSSDAENDDSSSFNGTVDCDQTAHSLTETPTKTETENNTNTNVPVAVALSEPCDSTQDSSSSSGEQEEASEKTGDLSQSEGIKVLMDKWSATFPQVPIPDQQKLATELVQLGMELRYPLEKFIQLASRAAQSFAKSGEDTCFQKFQNDGKIILAEYGKALAFFNIEHDSGNTLTWRAAVFLVQSQKNYKKFHDRNYPMTSGDRRATAEYFSREENCSPFDLCDLYEACLEKMKSPRPSGFDKFFACRQAYNFVKFFKMIERIRNELDW